MQFIIILKVSLTNPFLNIHAPFNDPRRAVLKLIIPHNVLILGDTFFSQGYYFLIRYYVVSRHKGGNYYFSSHLAVCSEISNRFISNRGKFLQNQSDIRIIEKNQVSAKRFRNNGQWRAMSTAHCQTVKLFK